MSIVTLLRKFYEGQASQACQAIAGLHGHV